MVIITDSERGKNVARLLCESFTTVGMHGRTDMPEDKVPKDVKKGSLEHILFITLTVSIDYQRDALSLWESSRKAFDDPETGYLFNPQLLSEVPYEKIVEDMRKYRLSRNPQKDANIWRTIGLTFYKKWGGDPRRLLEYYRWDSPGIFEHLKKGSADYPYLRGPKIAPLWLRMLRDNIGISELKRLDEVPIPVDIHVARATLATGVVRGQFRGKLCKLFKDIREAWFESVKGLEFNGKPMIALDMDSPLWRLSKYCCSHRKINGNCPGYSKCEVRQFFVQGKIEIERNIVCLDT